MKVSSSKQKAPKDNSPQLNISPTAGSSAASIAPPAYGMDSIDRAQNESVPESDQRQVVAGVAVQMKVDVSAAGGDAGAKPANRTGLPDKLKSGIESLSGYSLNDVHVHYNSPKPAKLQALAYTQGTEIHVAPAQERHLPHEAWHVVQQKQGHVRPTIQMKDVSINDDQGFEHEAEVMGKKAISWSEILIKKSSLALTQSNTADVSHYSHPGVMQMMGLTEIGSNKAQLAPGSRGVFANFLLDEAVGVENYINGVCYDAVAYLRYLLGGEIQPAELLTTSGQEWLPRFNFLGGTLWAGGPIEIGRAVGFYRLLDHQVFHASIGVGGTTVRGINGGLLGAGWHVAPRDLSTLVPVADQTIPNRYLHDNTEIQVWLSNL